jgi:glycosyltransferase involved in cell wall biosynthesis
MNSRIEHSNTLNGSILIIAYAFPPVPYSGSYRMIRLCKGLDNLGIRTHVLTINVYDDIPNDAELLSQVPPTVSIHRTPIIDPWRKYQSWKDRHKGMPGFRYINKITSELLRLITIPDHQILWIPFAFFKALKVIRNEGIDTILTTSPPNSTQLLGYFIRKTTKVQWLADFRDPIVGNIAEVHLLKPSGFLSRLEKRIRIWLEKLVVHTADKVIANTDTHRMELIEKFGTDKFQTIRNTFDEDDYEGVDTRKYPKFTIAHVGSMYGLRRADILFRAIRSLEAELLPHKLDLRVLFVGLNDQNLEKSMTESGVQNYVEIRRMVPHDEAIEVMCRSHLLLLVKATGEGSYGQIPAKFFEYLGTFNRILCLGPKESEVASIIGSLQAGYVVDDEYELIDILSGLYRNYLEGKVQQNTHPDLYKHSSGYMAKMIIETMAAKRPQKTPTSPKPIEVQ